MEDIMNIQTTIENMVSFVQTNYMIVLGTLAVFGVIRAVLAFRGSMRHASKRRFFN